MTSRGRDDVIDRDLKILIKANGDSPRVFLVIVTIPVETGNAAAKAEKVGATIGSILAELKPEAAYFTDRDGQGAGYIILDFPNASHIPAIAEPFSSPSTQKSSSTR
jgi:hypothetical protein